MKALDMVKLARHESFLYGPNAPHHDSVRGRCRPGYQGICVAHDAFFDGQRSRCNGVLYEGVTMGYLCPRCDNDKRIKACAHCGKHKNHTAHDSRWAFAEDKLWNVVAVSRRGAHGAHVTTVALPGFLAVVP